MTGIDAIEQLIHEALDKCRREGFVLVLVEEHLEIHLEELEDEIEFIVTDDHISERKDVLMFDLSKEGYLAESGGRNAVCFHFKFNFL